MPAKNVVRKFWRCEFCNAGGSVQVQLPGTSDADDAFAVRKAVEGAHERSAICHVFRYVLFVRVADKAIPKA